MQGHTDLTGAVIASNQLTVENNLNRLETGTLAAWNIENYSKYKASAVSVSGGYSFGVGADNKEIVSNMTEDKKSRATLSGSGASQLKGSEHSTTRSGISGGTIVITDLEAQRKCTGQASTEVLAILERDTRTGNVSGGLDKNWDGAKLAQQAQANAQIMTAFSQQAGLNIRAYTELKRKGLREQINNTNDPEQNRQLEQEMGTLNIQERLMNVFVGTLTGTVDTAVAHAVLSEAAEYMREYTIGNSSRFPRVIVGEKDGELVILNNVSGESAGVRGDEFKLGGVRVDLGLICGIDNKRCVVQRDENQKPVLGEFGIPMLKLNENNQVMFDPEAAGMSFEEFKKTKEGKKMRGLTGGVQGERGTIAGLSYAPGGFWDHIVESYAGTHDVIGGSLSGLYDEQGNTRVDRADAVKIMHEAWSAIAIAPSTPFALSEALPTEAWRLLDVLLRAQ